MKPSKEILNLIDKRMKYGELSNSYDAKVQEWCKCHNVNITDVVSDYGCMLTSEPFNYAKLTIECIEKA